MNKKFNELKKLLEEAQSLALDLIELESDEQLHTNKDIYGQIQDVINNLEELY